MDVDKEHNASSSIQRMMMATTTVIPAEQHLTKSPYNSPNEEDKTHTTTGASKGSPAGGSGAGGGDGKSSGKQGGKSYGYKGKSGKANRDDQKGNSAGSKDDQKNVKKVETEGGKEVPAEPEGTSGAGTGETSTLVTEVSSLIKNDKDS